MKVLMAEYRPWKHRIEDAEHKYARFFAGDGHRVFWLTHFLDLSRIVRRREDDLAFIKLWRYGVRSPEPNLHTFTPFSLLPYVPFPGLDNPRVAKYCLRYTVPSVKRILVKHGFGHVEVLWVGNPRLYSLIDLVTFDKLVYRMSDDMSEFPTGPRTMGQVEADICRRADLVFATAHNLVEKTEQFTSQVCYLPNGVDFHLFSTQPAQPPADLVDIPKPRLIYVGVIGAWFDFELVEFASQSLPGCSFVIIGPVEGGSHVQVGIEKLDRRDNIYLLGSRPFAQVPRYLNNSQVGLIPFVKNELTDSINPIKLFEYAAAGLPIVSRDLDETRALQSPALLYASPAEFIGGIQKALKDNNTLERAGREFGRRNSWRRRYRMIKNKLKLLGLEQGKEQCE